MSDALKRAEHYRDLAKGYLRLAASTENPNHYLRIAVQYNALAEAEELRTSHGDGDSAQRRSTVRKESDEVETGQRPKPIPVRGGRGQKSEMTIGTRRGEARMLGPSDDAGAITPSIRPNLSKGQSPSPCDVLSSSASASALYCTAIRR